MSETASPPTALQALAAVLRVLDERNLLGSVLEGIDEKWTGVGGILIMNWWLRNKPTRG